MRASSAAWRVWGWEGAEEVLAWAVVAGWGRAEEAEVVMGESAEDGVGAKLVAGKVNPWVCCVEDIGGGFVVDGGDDIGT